MNAYQQTAFWSRQFEEHLQFLSMLFTDPGAKRDAEQLHAMYAAARTHALAAGPRAPELIHHVHNLVRQYQGAMFDRLAAGEFLGWAFPLFVAHITREMDLYSHLVYGTAAPNVGVRGELKRLGAEHAQFAAHLLDPLEGKLVEQANAAADGLFALVQKDDDQSNGKAADAERAIATFVTSNKLGQPGGALSIIPKLLADHVVREQFYFADSLTSGDSR